MGRARKRHALLSATAAVVAAGSVMVGLAATSAVSFASAKSHATTHAAKVKGGTAYFAEPPGASPNYIFPFMPIQFFSINNITQFQYLMFRPLYWFGTDTQPVLNTALSLANPPTYTNGSRVVHVTLKPYKWSNGETVTAQDVLFWVNMEKAEKQNWAGYSAGAFPDDVTNVTINSPTSLTFTLNGPVNSYWFTYNEVAQITPLPMAWDVSATGQKAGSQLCGTSSFTAVRTAGKTNAPVTPAARSCVAVFDFLSKSSGFNPANPKAANNAQATYATNPLWQVVDGPWHLTSFNSSGYAAMKPNPKYSGPTKPTLSQFVEEPFTSNSAEFNALVGGKLSFGYMPFEDITSPAKSTTVAGPNNPRLGNFNLVPWYSWSINYFPYNFNSTGNNGMTGKILHQLYVRQTFQSLIDQNLYIKKLYKGYASPTYGPVPTTPKSLFATPFEQKNPYPYNVSKAKQLLTSNGWDVKPGGVTTCGRASGCTGGIPKGTQLVFNLQYRSGDATLTSLMNAEASSWAQVGIKVNLSTATFNTVIGNATPCSGASCTWELAFWGGGWIYAPDYYPTGELIFQTGAGSNVGSYSDPTNDSLIRATNTKAGLTTLYTWQNYLAKQLPFAWQPNEAYQLNEVQKSLAGVAAANPMLNLNPENWYFTK
ncbi:MAG TPA: ABC transporter substrate-binding protein [Acidimicrobiales bacterium]|nr:ABC transporter substrate-binding protein [Acidimicrobiales bacterium]